MTTATSHRHTVEFRRREGVTAAVCGVCHETLIEDVHAWSEAEEADANGLPRAETIDVTLRELIDRRFNSVH